MAIKFRVFYRIYFASVLSISTLKYYDNLEVFKKQSLQTAKMIRLLSLRYILMA